MEVNGAAVRGHVLERLRWHHSRPGHDAHPNRRPHGPPRPRRLRHRHDPRRLPVRARPAPGPLPAVRRQGEDRHPVPARHPAQHPGPDDRGVQLPKGLHPVLAECRPRRLPALLQWLLGPGVLRRRHPHGLLAVPPRRPRRDHVGAHEAAAVRHHEERQLPPQRAVHHGGRGARRVRVRMGGREGLRRRGPHGERRLRDAGRRAGAARLRQYPQRVHRQAAPRARAQAGGGRPAQGRQHRAHHRRRRQALRRDGLRRQQPALAAHRRVGRPAHRRREGGEADACAVGSALGGHEVGAGQARGSLQVIQELEQRCAVYKTMTGCELSCTQRCPS